MKRIKEFSTRWLIVNFLNGLLNKEFTYGNFEQIKEQSHKRFGIIHHMDEYTRELRFMIEDGEINNHFKFTKRLVKNSRGRRISIMKVNKLRGVK